MAKKISEITEEVKESQAIQECSRRALAARFLKVPEKQIIAYRDTDDGGIVVVLESGPKMQITGAQLGEAGNLDTGE